MSDETTNPFQSENTPTGSIIDAAEIAAAHPASEAPRKKRGRPPKSAAVADDPKQASGAGQQSSVGGGVALSPETRQQVICSIGSLIKIIDSRCQRMVEKTAFRVTGDKGFAKGLAEDVAMTETESETICTLTVVVVEKYNLLGTYAPEAMLGIALIGYGYRVHSAMSDLKKLANETTQNGLPAPTQPTVDNGKVGNGEK